MISATIGSRFQVVIPKEERERLNLKPNTLVNVEARDDCIMIFPVNFTRLRGLGRELAISEDAGDYVKHLRNEWDMR